MNFRDEINNTIQNASNYEAEAAKRKQEAIQQEVDGVCDWVRNRIKAKASWHTNPNIPFKVTMYFACHISEAFTRNEVAQLRRAYNSPEVCELTLSKDILIREQLIRNQLKSDGITVGKWQLYTAYVDHSDDVVPMPRYSCSYARAFGVYKENEIRDKTLIKIDPYKSITETITCMRLPSTIYTYTFSQGGISFKRTPSARRIPDLYLIMPISFS